ncbi:Pyrroline-5-carboxylate reductase [invertebrate metagenome]|uniref:Pyrroline-5-carboxylate reductase n=1 Tax=invertebrate metagenome TaxID=1711999 RepID=A0A484H6G2_9ZZZZ
MVMNRNMSVLLVGGGRMGCALLEGWHTYGLATDRLWVVEPDTGARCRMEMSRVVSSAIDLPLDLQPNVVVFAVKPQNMETIVTDYQRFANDSVFLSIVAGKSIAWFTNSLGSTATVVRAMPNLPAAVRRGVTVACGNAALDADGHALCTSLLEAVGAVVWIEEERLLDAVTAVSGSGPAYVFLLAESLARAGQAVGLPASLAERLAHLTVTGAGELLYHSVDSTATLRQKVTSPGGTTAAALAVLMDPQNGLEWMLTRAVAAATARSRELSL